MEEENWDAIGAPVYIRGFLRTYARYLKLDPEEAVAEFNATLPEPPPPKSFEPERSPASRSRGLLLIWIAGTVAVLLVAFVVYNELTLRGERSALATTTRDARAGFGGIAVAAAPGLVAHPGRRRPQLAGLGVLGALMAAGYG